MKQDSQISIKQNYRFIRATPETVAYILMRVQQLTWMQKEKISERDSFDKFVSAVKRELQMVKGAQEALERSICNGMRKALKIPEFASMLQVEEYQNLVPSVLRNSLATLISGTTVTPTFKCNYFALGTGTTAPANADTQLQTEALRSLFTNREAEENAAYLDVYFTNAQVGGNTYLEAGMFVDGASGANTGYLLSRVAINQSIGSAETLTVNCSITIS
jgi:hypothetical protein